VRALFSFTGGLGHFLPTEPFARLLRERGHEVLYACQEGMVRSVEGAGWDAVATGGSTLLDPRTRRPLAPLDREAEEKAVRFSFAGRVARERTGRLLDVARDWRPDLVVRDEMDFAGAVAAEAIGVPHAAVVVIAAGGFLRPEVVAEPLAALRAEHGLEPPEDAMGMLHRYLTLVPAPPSFRHPGDPLPATAHWVRPAVLDRPGGPEPPATGPRPEAGAAPRIYVTLGTIFNQESGDLFGRVLAGLAGLPVQVLATVGHQLDPGELGSLPPNVRVEPFVPLARALAGTDVVVSHGGSGTVIAALALGIPQLVLPMGADQPLNADRCAALGVGMVLDALSAGPHEVREATRALLGIDAYRQEAARIQDEIESLPDARHGARLLEDLARTGAPVLAP